MIDERTIRFDLQRAHATTACSRSATLQVFSRKWALGADGKPSASTRSSPNTRSPAARTRSPRPSSGRRIEFKRNPNYWARDLPVAARLLQLRPRRLPLLPGRGRRDRGVQGRRVRHLQGVRRARLGAPAQGPEVGRRPHQEGPVPDRVGQGLQSYQLNLRRPMFQDIRVREALGLTYDFETQQPLRPVQARQQRVQQLRVRRRRACRRRASWSCSSRFAAELPPEVFGPPYRRAAHRRRPAGAAPQPAEGARAARSTPAGSSPPTAGCATPRASRSSSSTWRRATASMRDARMGAQPRQARHHAEDAQRRLRAVPPAPRGVRLRHDHDRRGRLHAARRRPTTSTSYGSKSADEKGNNNFRGVKSAAVDHMLDAMSRARRRWSELRDACRALDRVVMWNYWQVPELYAANEPRRTGTSSACPRCGRSTSRSRARRRLQPAWPITTWWIQDPAKR